MQANVILFEDQFVDDMWPITLTRPAFGVTCAAWNLYELARLVADRVGYIVRDHVAKVTARAFPRDSLGEGPVLFLNASVAPDTRYCSAIADLLSAGEPFLCTAGQRVSAALLPAGTRPPQIAHGDVMPYLLGLDLPLGSDKMFRLFDYPFHVIGALEEMFPANIERRIAQGAYSEVRPGVFAGKGVRCADTAVFHTGDGPVVLSDEVRVLDFALFEGPVYVGPRSRVIERASLKECVCVGHTCKVGGEVEASIIEAYTNKQHHGFLGHAYAGSWVNLGAGTSNSDLKNTYGEVRVEHRGRRIETGMQFLGCVIGDFSKSAINTSIFTGKTVGVASMLYGYVGQNVPSFCNYARSFGQVTECPPEQAIVTQERMFARRSVKQTEDDVALLRAVFEVTRQERMISNEPLAL